MKNVLVFGTFDSIHPGHEYFLENAYKLGNHLIVVVARDCFVRQFKNRDPLHNERDRLRFIKNHPLVGEAYLADETQGTYSILSRIHPDIICLGHDQTELEENLRDWMKDNHQKFHIKKLAPFKRDRYSSTLLNRLKVKMHHEEQV